MKISSTQPSLEGEMQFFENYVPVLHDGDYTITVTQAIKGKGEPKGNDADHSFQQSQKFTIAGPRFSLDPADLHREFPPPGHQGRFESVLPHLAFKKRALPWERKIFASDATPWLALLVFAEDEILEPIIGTGVDQGNKPNPTKASTILLEELTDPIPAGKVVYPDVKFDPYEKAATSLCKVIDIAPKSFEAIVPSQDDLAYLAHGRKVNIMNKSASVTVKANGARIEDGTQWFSVLVSGRFPDASTGSNAAASTPAGSSAVRKNIVHVVSLEGLTQYIPQTAGGTATPFPAGTERVRLVSLASWTFDCLPVSGESFADLMKGLVPAKETDRDDLLLRLPVPKLPEVPTAIDNYNHAAITSGYTAKTYATRQGENTFAWNRGPFVPVLPERLPPGREPFSVSGQAVIYDKDKGLFDLSYASAFEIGRLAAVNSGVMTSSLLSWRSKGRQLLDRLQQRLSSSVISRLFSNPEEELKAEAVLKNAMLTDLFMDHLTADFLSGIMPKVKGAAASQPVRATAMAVDTSADDAQLLKQALQNEDIADFLRSLDHDELAPILTFLANLYLLHGVPFNYIVPDERMLPDESVRFSYIDRNWLDTLVEGAMSVGLHTGIDVGFQTAMNSVIRAGLLELLHNVRDKLLGIDTPSPNDAGDLPLAGILIRSTVISGWPGLEVKAEDKDGNPIGLLRMDHVGPRVLLCIFAGIPKSVSVSEPQEGLHFGVESNDAVYLRYLSGEKVGFLLDPQKTITASVNADRKLDIKKALADMKAGLGATTDLGPAEFAVEMVDVPERFEYTMPGEGT